MAHNTEVAVVPPTTEPVARSAAAARMRAHRELRRLGLRCVTVQLFEKEIDALVLKGLLKADARHDLYALGEALHAFFARTLGSRSDAKQGDRSLRAPSG